ncbi:MAG: cation:proton antiporter subunit C, partial [Nitrospinota bacterium]
FCFILFVTGLCGMMASSNLFKKVLGMGIFQAAVLLFYVSAGKVTGGTAPILTEGAMYYDNPLPHTLMLTAIVVGVATMAVALSLIRLIYSEYGSVEEDEINAKEEGF